jgi:hypothetical protein
MRRKCKKGGTGRWGYEEVKTYESNLCAGRQRNVTKKETVEGRWIG